MPVKDIARRTVVTVPPDTPVAEVARKMRDENVGSVVVERDGNVAGIVTDRDVALRTTAENLDPEAQTASSVMSEDVCCIEETAGVFELTEAMRDNGVRRIPVVDDDGLTGIITLDDVTRLFTEEQQNLADVIESESPTY